METNYFATGEDNSKERIQLMKILIEYKYGDGGTTEEVTDKIMETIRIPSEK